MIIAPSPWIASAIAKARWVEPRLSPIKPIAVAVAVAIMAAGLAGCGQKGALYLPGHNPNPPPPLMQPENPDQKSSGSARQKRDSQQRRRASRPPATD